MSPFSIASRVFILAALTLLVLLGLAGWFLRDQIYQTFQDPGEPFQTYSPPTAADYADASAWFVRAPLDSDHQPALFFVHPTTYSGGANWNAQLDKESANLAVTNVSLPNYAAPFADSAALFAPRYRQASLYAFMNNREDGVLAREFAYMDVQRAFRAFRDTVGDDRPILLAGIGQGGLHVLGLLMDMVATDDDLRDRLIAAYIIDSPVPLDLFEGPLQSIPACETPDDVRCVFAYSAVEPVESRRIRIMTERLMSWSPDAGLDFIDERGLLCVNPLLGERSNEYASARLHRGGVAAEGFSEDAIPAPIPAQTGAQCADGLLMIETVRSPALRRPDRLAEDFREPPFNLFYEDLRMDAARRSINLATILGEERRWAPPLDDPESVEEAPVVPIPDRRRTPY